MPRGFGILSPAPAKQNVRAVRPKPKNGKALRGQCRRLLLLRKVRDVPECAGCPMRLGACTYHDKNGKEQQWVGADATFVAPKLGPAPRLQVLEAPGEDESQTGEPATGGAGSWLNIMNRSAGIRREDINIANVIQCRPPENVFPTAGEAKFYISKEDGERAVQHCLKAHVQPLLASREWKRIDIFGDTPLRYVVGKTEGILKWRGSPLPIPGLGDAPITVPTVHPAFVMRNQIYSRVVSADLRKGLVVPPEHYNLKPSLEDVRRFDATEFAFDIETDWGANKIFLVGLSAKPYEALVVPFQGEYIAELKRIFWNATSLTGQNAIQFDLPVLQRHGISIHGDIQLWDIMLLQHLLFPDLPHDLEFISSQFTQKPAWKHGMKEDFELYNARDVDVTLQCFQQLLPRLRRQGLENLYNLVQVPLAKICKHMSDTGFAVNPGRIVEVRGKLIAEMGEQEKLLPESLRTHSIPVRKRELAPPGTKSPKTGKPLRYFTVEATEEVVPWRSGKEMEEWLYGTLGLPKQYHPKTQQVTTDKTAIAKLHRRLLAGTIKCETPGVVQAISALSKLRRTSTLVNSFLKEKFADVGRMHSHFNVHGTASGRLSSSDPNLQNIPESSRFIYVPSHPDWVIVEADYSSIENRLTALFAGDTERLGRLADPGFNEHKYMTSQFYGIPYELVEKSNDTDAPYRKAKCINHGCVTGDHEVLTPSGWIKIRDYKNEKIAQWDAITQEIKFIEPKAYVEKEWTGDLYTFKGRAFCAKVTPDHAFPARKGRTRYFRVAAEKLDLQHRLPVNGNFAFGEIDNIDIQLAAAVQADSTISNGYACFHLVRQRKIARLKEILKRHGASMPRPCGCHKNGIRAQIKIDNIPILTGKLFNEKVLQLTKKKARYLLTEVLLWDGCINGWRREFLTTDYQSAVWIQTLAHMLGHESLLRIRPNGKGHFGSKKVFCVSFNARKEARAKNFSFDATPCHEKVYCFTTDTGYFLFRFDDTIAISGNTNYGEGAMKISKTYDLDFQEVKVLLAQWKELNHQTVKWQAATAASAKKQGVLTNPFGRKRWFYTSSYYTESLAFLPSSTGADIIYRAMLALMYERIGWPVEKVLQVVDVVEPLPAPAELLLQVHDSLVFECPRQMVDQLSSTLHKVMEQPWKELGGYAIPIAIKGGESWGAAEGIE